MAAVFNELLIEVVKSKPELWQPKSSGHRNTELVKKLWEEVGQTLGCDGDTAKTRWRTLKDRFVKEIKKGQGRRITGSGATASVKWPLLENLQFLQATVTPRKTIGNYEGPTLVDLVGMDEDDILNEITITEGDVQTLAEVEDSPEVISTPSTLPGSPYSEVTKVSSAVPTKKRKRCLDDHPLEQKILENLASASSSKPKEYTAEELFYLSVAKDAANLSLSSRLFVRGETLKALAEAVEREGKNDHSLFCVCEIQHFAAVSAHQCTHLSDDQSVPQSRRGR